MDWLPSKEIFDLVITVTIIKHIQRSRGREDLQEITSDNVDFWPHGKYKCELRFIKRRHVYKTSSAFNSPFCNTAKLRDNTKSKLLKDISNGAQKTSPTSFSLSNLFLVFKSKWQNTLLFSAQTYLFLLLYIFSLTIDGMFLWVTVSYNIWLCCSNIDPSGEYVWMRRTSGWGSAPSLSSFGGVPPAIPFHDVCTLMSPCF